MIAVLGTGPVRDGSRVPGHSNARRSFALPKDAWWDREYLGSKVRLFYDTGDDLQTLASVGNAY